MWFTKICGSQFTSICTIIYLFSKSDPGFICTSWWFVSENHPHFFSSESFFVSFSSWIWHSTCLSAHLRGLEQPLLPWWAFPLLSLMFYLSFFLTLLLCFCIVCIFRESKCPFRAIHEIWIDLWVLLILWMYRHLHERKYEIYAQQVCYRNQGLVQNYSLKACLKWNRHPRPLVK